MKQLPESKDTLEVSTNRSTWPLIRYINDFSIGQKLNLGFGLLVVLILLLVVLQLIHHAQTIATIRQTGEVQAPSALTSAQAQTNLLSMLAGIRGYLILGSPSFRQEYLDAKAMFEQNLVVMKALATQEQNPDLNRQLAELETTYERWSDLPDQMFALRDNPIDNQPALRILTEEGEVLISNILSDINSLIWHQSRREPSMQNAQLLKDMAEVQSSFALMIASLRSYLATSDVSFRRDYNIKLSTNHSAWQQMINQQDHLNANQQPLFASMAERRKAFLAVARRVIDAVEGPQARQDLFLFTTQTTPLADTMLQLLGDITTEQQLALTNDLAASQDALIDALQKTILGGLIAIGLGFGLAVAFRQNIAGPVERLTRTVAQITGSNLQARVQVESRDEIGRLAATFNTMTDRLQESLHELEQRTRDLETAVDALQSSKDAAEAASRAKSQFLANMSHELRTPLNAIIGYSEILQEDARDAEMTDFGDDLAKIQTAGEHLLDLINDVLNLSDIETGRLHLYLESFDIATMVDDVVATIQPLVNHRQNTLHITYVREMGRMHADQTKVRQILFNLLGNAAKFTQNGSITLEIDRLDPPVPGVSARQPQDEPAPYMVPAQSHWIVFRIRDTGIGISSEQIDRLFEAFSQADASSTRRYGGMGLGLALSYQFCRLMAGSITVESTVGIGSLFTIYLPSQILYQAETPAARPEADPHELAIPVSTPTPSSTLLPAETTAHRPTLLIIDDDVLTCELVSRVAVSQGINVQTALDGQEGLRRARELHPDAIMLDVMMPRMNGWAVLALLKADAELATIPVIMSTVLDDKRKGKALGADAYLTKPLDRKHLAEILRKYSGLNKNGAATILLVEDDLATRDVFQRMFEQVGWHVICANHGLMALEQLAEQQPDLIVLDLMMPEMDGFQVVTVIRAIPAWRTIPIVVVTAKELSHQEQEQLQPMVNRTLQKGQYSRETLIEQIRMVIDEHHLA
ncbi:MAG: response regulator [Chloroflexaceae bacterium]|nr:response regulator [Chloroflexaceae bacterium]